MVKKKILLIIVGFLIPWSVFAEDIQTQEPAAEKIQLHNLSNEELLKHAQTIFNEASDKFNADLRGVFGNDMLFEQARANTLEISSKINTSSKITSGAETEVVENVPSTVAAVTSNVPSEEMPSNVPSEEIPSNVPSEEMPSLEVAKLTLDDAKTRLDLFNQLIALTEAEKTLVEQQISQIEAAKSTAGIFADRLNDLDRFVLEIELRISDGTLVGSEIPVFLTTNAMTNKKEELSDRQVELQEKLTKMQTTLDNIVSSLEKIKQNAIEIETNYSATKEKYSQELKQQKVEQEYSTKMPAMLLAEIAKLQEERVWINGTFNLSYRRFNNQQKNVVSRLEQELAALPPPDMTKLQITQAEEAQQAAKIAEEIKAYHTDRIVKLRNLQTNLKSLMEYGESLEVDATVLSEHTFKMLVIARTFEGFVGEGKMRMDSIPENSRSEALTIIDNKLSKQLSTALSAMEKAKVQLVKIDDEIEKSKVAQIEVSTKLTNLKKIYESAQQSQQWESKLKNLPAEQIVKSFQDDSKKIINNQQVLQKLHDKFETTQTVVKKVKLGLESLKDPLLRLAQQESLKEKRDILKTLYQFAELVLPADQVQPAVKASSNETVVETSDKLETEDYQNLLANRTRIIEKQQEQRANLLKTLNLLNKQVKQYTNILSETNQIASQHYANAVELKKRLGRGQLSDDEIPDGITEALKSNIVTELSNKTTKMMNYQINIQQQIENLNQQDDTLKETQTLLKDIQNLAGKRIDISVESQKLEQDFERERNKLSKTELKTLEQDAIRRMESENSTKEFLLSFVPSERAKGLTDFMQEYYLELKELENKQGNLQKQKNKIERLTRLAESEKPIITKLLPLLQKQKAELEVKKEEEWVKIQVQLMPQKADEILKNFEAKTGHSIPIPAVIPEELKTKIIEEATALIFDWHIQIVAIDKWVALFEQKLSAKGIDVEIGSYQDKLGILNAKESTIQRRIQYILGHPQEELAILEAEKIPKTAKLNLLRLRFLEGEIGILRADIYQIRTQAALRVFVELFSIFLIALLLNWFINLLVNYTLRKANRIKNRNAYSIVKSKPVGTFIILLPLLRTIIIFIVWVIAIIFGLSTLGFEAGAVLAGLGIGGLAIAMASQKTISDMIGGISILIAGSFKIGDIILYDGVPAVIEDISLRYTRLREASTDYLHTVPNSLLSERSLANISAADPGIYLTMSLPLSIDTTADKLELATKIITEVIAQNPNASLNWLKFHSFEEFSFMFQSSFTVEWSQRNIVQTEIYTEVVRRLQQNNIGFSHPV